MTSPTAAPRLPRPTHAPAPAHETAASPEAVGFLLIPGFTLMTFAAAIEPLRLANMLTGRALYRWTLLSRDGGPVASSGGVPVAPGASIAAAPPLATIVVCGGLGSHLYDDRHVLSWLRRMAASGLEIGSLCVGSHILARAGLLEGYRCTIHWDNLAGFTEAFPRLDATGELFTVDRKRFTAAGGTVGLDLMLHRIAQRHGERLAVRIAEQLLHDRIRPGAVRQHEAIQPDPHVDRDDLAAVLALMQEHLEAPLPVARIAARIGTSRRNLERLFRRSLGATPAQHYLRLRLRRARQLLTQTRMSVTAVSVSCGFQSPAHFSKTYRAVFGVSPRQDQRRQRTEALAG